MRGAGEGVLKQTCVCVCDEYCCFHAKEELFKLCVCMCAHVYRTPRQRNESTTLPSSETIC